MRLVLSQPRLPLTGLLAAVLMLCVVASGASQERKSDSQPVKRPSAAKGSAAKKSAGKPVDADTERAALEFVRHHYPPLMEVLIYLKENNPRNYHQAIFDLDRTRTKLAQVRERSPKRYQLELEGWKLKSEIQLVSARLAMEDSPQLKAQLKRAVARQIENKLAILMLDRTIAAQRVARLDDAIEKLQQKREREVERITNQLMARVQRMSKSHRKSARPDGQPKTKKKKQNKGLPSP